MSFIQDEAARLLPYVQKIRRELHSFPELSMKESRTSQLIADALEAMGLECVRLRPTGVIAEIRGGKPGPTVVLRADIDALPIVERSGVDFSSQNEGVMHACGHDAHAAMLLGAARLLQSGRKDMAGNVRLIFQPGEESGEGGLSVIAQGGVDGAQAAFAIHVASQVPSGMLASRTGAMFPSVGMFTIHVTGQGCHGAMPEKGADATLAAAAILMNLQSIVSRNVPPMSPAVITVGTLHSGSGYNVISGKAVMEGTVRVFDDELHKRLPALMQRVAEHTAEAMGCTAQLEYSITSPALVTDADVTGIAKGAASKLTRPEYILWDFPGTMGGEDFAVYTHRLPCSYVFLGVGGEHPMHSEYFVIDEDAMAVGVALYAQFALDYLAAHKT